MVNGNTVRYFTLILIFVFMAPGCKKESPPAVATPDADSILSSVPVAPPVRSLVQEPPVVIVEADIALFMSHFPGVNEIAERYNVELDKKTKNPGIVRSEGQIEIKRHLKEKGLDSRLFMRKAAKIIRGWLALRILSDPNISDKKSASSYLRPFSAEERAILEKHYDELSTVLKDASVKL
ncbi:MAG TPA: hypothetical protein PLV42_11660 [bacterium]|nr:hypothetical protein [bacterium]